jgi:hypothetical protein
MAVQQVAALGRSCLSPEALQACEQLVGEPGLLSRAVQQHAAAVARSGGRHHGLDSAQLEVVEAVPYGRLLSAGELSSYGAAF